MENNNELLEKRRILKIEIKDMEIELQYKRKKLWEIEERLKNDKRDSEDDGKIGNSTTNKGKTAIGNGINEQYEENINENQETEKRETRKRKRVNYNEIMETDREEGERSQQGRKRTKRKLEIRDLLEEISEEEMGELEPMEIKWEEMVEGISKQYYKLCEWEGFLSMEKRKMMEIYYDFGKECERRINDLTNRSFISEKTAISKVYKEIRKENSSHSYYNIKRRVEKSRKIFQIIFVEGGKRKISRLKNLTSEDFVGISFLEISKWVENQRIEIFNRVIISGTTTPMEI